MELLRCLSANEALGAFAARLIPRHRCLALARDRGLLQTVIDAGSSAAFRLCPSFELSNYRTGDKSRALRKPARAIPFDTLFNNRQSLLMGG